MASYPVSVELGTGGGRGGAGKGQGREEFGGNHVVRDCNVVETGEKNV